MQKNHFEKELKIDGTQQRKGTANNRKDIMKIQSWLNLFSLTRPTAGTATAIDGDFGAGTEKALSNFQNLKGIPTSGMATQDVFDLLCEPMRNAFQNVSGGDLRRLILGTAELHLKNAPFELTINGESNRGPWVRAYMDNHEGESWFWCMGFVQTIIDQAATALGKTFKSLMPLTYGCDVVGSKGLETGLLRRYTEVRKDPATVKPGDIFLLQKTPNDWIHTGIIISVENEVFVTIEGNTNAAGSRDGNAVSKKMRNFMTSKLDVFSIEPLV